MIEYGYINENGSLVSKFLEEYSEKFKNEETGEIETRIVSIQEQQTELSALGWKHVELVDDTKLQCPEYYSVRIVPYDAGDKISYKYEQRFNAKLVRNKIDELKASLTSNDSVIGDYRITKCYEASLIGLYMFAVDGEFGAEVYSGATSQDQAMEVFRPALLMSRATPRFWNACPDQSRSQGPGSLRSSQLLARTVHG
jgi:hypothetical protein